MILLSILSIILAIFSGMISAVNIPTWGIEVQSAFNFVTTMLVQGTAFLAYLLSPPVLAFCVVSVIAVFNFSWIYGMARWVVEKLPFLNIRL